MRIVRSYPAIFGVFAVSIALAALASLLPDNPYQRWQQLHGTIYQETRWVYERLHFDPTPIDVAIVGSSRTRQGVSAPQLEAALAARGLPSRVANFSILSPGRGTDLTIVQELLSTKHPKLIVVGIQESPDREEHAAYKYIAPAASVVTPSLWRAQSYLSDLLFLPFRQMKLFASRLFPSDSGLQNRFVRSEYPGSLVETTGDMVYDGKVHFQAEVAAPLSVLYADSLKFTKETQAHGRLTNALLPLKVAEERQYLNGIVALAKSKGAKVVFLYVPYFNGPNVLANSHIYDGMGPVWTPPSLTGHPEWRADFVHLTRRGASFLTDWLITPVAAELASGASGGRQSPAEQHGQSASVASSLVSFMASNVDPAPGFVGTGKQRL